jgi:hypothetical protein
MSRKPKNPQGVVIWEGPSAFDGSPIVLIATNLVRPSANSKTGAMVQVFILRSDRSPMGALADGTDDAICGSCPLRGEFVDGKRVGRGCYVEVAKSVSAVFEAYRNGTYPHVTPAEARILLAGRKVRLGAYGDPAMVPYDVVAESVADARFNTGYTHQWQDCDPRFKGLLMASADGSEDYRLARREGWRSFVVVAASAELPAGTVECLAESKNLQCADCGACGGTRLGSKPDAVSISIRAHGPGKGFVMAT